MGTLRFAHPTVEQGRWAKQRVPISIVNQGHVTDGACCHVIGRGDERRDIYKDHDDYLLLLEKPSDSLEVYNVSSLGFDINASI
ncbi:hypothetical protein JCM14469_24510 [Desulfatiferula olefinivorans]